MNNKGVVLIVVLWVLLVLSLIAWGLGRRSSLEVSLTENYRGKLRSYAAARAELNTILDQLQRSPSTKDSLYATGIAIDPTKTPADIFSHIDIGQNAYAMVQWQARNYNVGDSNPHMEYGLRDEGGRININAINSTNYQILSALLQLHGLSQSQADQLTQAIINYTGINAQASTNGAFMTSDESTLKPKNKHYENILELLEVNGMTQDIFNNIQDDVTVYGDTQNALSINTDTANNDVIMAVANAAARVNPSVAASDIISQAYTIRDGADGLSFTADDGVQSIASINDSNWPAALQEGSSNSSYYRARVVGVDGDSGARTVLDVVIHRSSGTTTPEIVGWQRE